jgi:putative RecB family exonuclease
MPRRAPSQRQPAKPRFSPTRLRLYLFCPKAYHYTYVRGLHWGGMTAATSFGGSLHRTLQAFHQTGPLAPPSIDDLLDTFRSSWNTAGYRDTAEEAEHQQAGEAILRQYFEAAQASGRETVLVERQVQWEYPDYLLIGKIDRLDRLPGGELEVIDYKSGRREVTEEEVHGSLAMAIYQLIVARQHPGVPVLATLLCLPTGNSATVHRSEAELDELEQDLGKVVARLLAETEYAATPGPHCARCSFERICPAAWTKRPAPEGGGEHRP